MKRRNFLFAMTALGAFALTGCSKNHNEPFVGYWLQETERRPVSLHIKEDGPDLIVTIGQLVFGKYNVEHEPGEAKQEHVLTVGDGKKQLRYDNDTLVDMVESDVRFRRVNEQQYKAAATVK